MAISFSKNWEDEIWPITQLAEYQSCTIQIIDPKQVEGGEYDYKTDTYAPITNDGTVYSGQARFIPSRAGNLLNGEAQANSSTIRAVRFQLPKSAGPKYIRKGLRILITDAPRNPSLEGRYADVTDDFQGSSSATRTVNAMMDIDSGDSGA